ncbi:hypothetical protein GQ457_08G006910 [Hibiscus cannabinus]
MSLTEANVACPSEFFVKKSMLSPLCCRSPSSSVSLSTYKDIGRSTSRPLLYCRTDFVRASKRRYILELYVGGKVFDLKIDGICGFDLYLKLDRGFFLLCYSFLNR